MHDGRKAVWSIPYISVAFFPSLKQNFITYRSSKVSDCILEIHQLWQSGFSRVYFNCCCSCSFEPEIIKIGQSSYKMYSNNIVDFQESTTILNTCPKKVLKLIECTTYHSSVCLVISNTSSYNQTGNIATLDGDLQPNRQHCHTRRSLSETSRQIHLPRKQRLINREGHRHTTDEGMDSYR